MSLLVITFILSGILLTLFLFLKSRSLDAGRRQMFGKLFHEDESVLQARCSTALARGHAHLRHTATHTKDVVIASCSRGVAATAHTLAVGSIKVRNAVRGKGELTKKGAASFHLKHIAEHKKANTDKRG